MKIPKHIAPTILLCLVPYVGLVVFLLVSHNEADVVKHPAAFWLVVLVVIGAVAPLARLGALLRLLMRERDRFRLGLLIEVYASLVLIFASLFALLQVGQVDPAFDGMLGLWSAHEGGTLSHHLGLLTSIFGEALYLSVMTITTVGFGDIVPVSALARALVVIEALAGIGYLGLVLGQYFSFCTHERISGSDAA